METITYMTNLYAIFSPEGSGESRPDSSGYARQVLGLFMGHATYTALVGAGIGIARQLPSRRQKVIAILTGSWSRSAAHFHGTLGLRSSPSRRHSSASSRCTSAPSS